MKTKYGRISVLWFAACVSAVLSGCATVSPRAVQGPGEEAREIPQFIVREHADDARYSTVRGKEYLAFDTESKNALGDYSAAWDVQKKREFVTGVLSSAKDRGVSAVEVELKRVSAEKLASYGGYDKALSFHREKAGAALESEKLSVSVLDGTGLDRYTKDLSSRIGPSIKTRGRGVRQLLGLPLAPFVKLWMGFHVASTPHPPADVRFEEAEVYRPEASGVKDPASADDAALLRFYAPVIVMEKKAAVRYDAKSDRFGKIVMEGEGKTIQPKVDVERPTVYAYAETKTVQGAPVKFLVYTLWFPERPQIGGGFDPEVGPTQGSIIRISLDRANRPVIYENVSSCGCYYKVFPTEALERRSAEQYGAPLPDKRFSSQNRVPGKIDADVPSVVKGNPKNVLAFYASGTHDVLDIQPDAPASMRLHEAGSYELVPYDELESLPFRGGTISMFDADGLVRSADRAEAALMAASGMYHAGTPRQRGTLMIYFDQADFDDRKLLETYLRLPDHAFGDGS